MPTTSNFGWTTPADTDLVKDGAAAIRTLGNGIDTSFLDLKGGTTGQVLSKASNTDLDFSWIAVDPLTILDAKGDLISATAADTPARLAVGTNGQYLSADSSTSTGLKWVTPAGGGKVLQVVYGSYTTETTIASTSYTDTGLSASITPSSASSKVYVIVVQQARINRNTSNENAAGFRLLRGATQVFENGNSLTGIGGGGTGLTTFFQVANMPLTYLDSPSTTSSTTYKIQGRAYTTANGGELVAQYSSGQSQITLIEIGA